MKAAKPKYVIVKNIDVYIQSNIDRANVHAIIYPNGDYVYLCNGIEMPGAEFEANNPLPQLQENRNEKGMRLDSRSNWFD